MLAMAYRYNTELRELVSSPEGFPPATVFTGSLEEMRQFADPIYQEMRELPIPDEVVTADYSISTSDGQSFRARWYRRKNLDSQASQCAAVIYVHGGGMILMGIDEMNSDISRYVCLSGVPFLSIEYRLAPDNPRPMAEDAYDALLWLHEHSGELGVAPDRIALMGDSGGGGIAAGAAILARDRGVNLAEQILIYPMLDDRTVISDPELEPFLHAWFTDNNRMAWDTVLGARRGTDDVLPCEAPARNTDFDGLAPAFMEVGELDMFRNETVEYARHLMAAHVPTELHVLGGLTHTYDTFPLTMAQKAFEYRSYIISQL